MLGQQVQIALLWIGDPTPTADLTRVKDCGQPVSVRESLPERETAARRAAADGKKLDQNVRIRK
jgi:hypothetical protein